MSKPKDFVKASVYYLFIDHKFLIHCKFQPGVGQGAKMYIISLQVLRNLTLYSVDIFNMPSTI